MGEGEFLAWGDGEAGRRGDNLDGGGLGKSLGGSGYCLYTLGGRRLALITVLFPRHIVVGLSLAILGALACPALGGDWPGYRHDASRCAFTPEQVGPSPRLQWTWQPRHEPSPAWPDPVRERLLMPFDYACHVAASDGAVYFGSSTDHAVYAVDAATGRLRWRYVTDGPIRFAPAIWHDKVFVASDDGWLYCLSAAKGKLLWRFRGGPADERILGNEQMISRWPLRSGLAIVDDTIYFTAGFWPMEGVYAYALNADDGKVVQRTEHRAKFAPQGYMAADKTRLIAPAGRAPVRLIDRATGKVSGGKGHGWAMVRSGLVLAGGPPFKANENLPGPGGLDFRHRPESIYAWRADGKGKPQRLAGRSFAAADLATCYAAGNDKVAAYALDTLKPKWETDCGQAFAIAVAGKSVIVGGADKVSAFSTETGKPLWSVPIVGEGRGLAVADGRLLVSTETGRIICLGAGKPAAKPDSTVTATSRRDDDAAALAGRILKDTGVTAGMCLLLGVGDGCLPIELANQSELRIFCVEPDGKKVAAARKLLDEAGLYGQRVVVHEITPPKLPYPGYFANLVVVHEPNAGATKNISPSELYRVLHPYGGTVYVEQAEADSSPQMWVEGPGLRRTILSARTRRVVRGELAGAGQWTHQYANAGNSASSGDQLVKWPLKVLWFGKPGPGRMMNRHLRGTAPLFSNGRMFILGQHSVIAVDAYNGRELWSRPMPSVQRRVVDIRGGNMVADDQSILISTGDLCFELSAQTGQLARGFRLPFRRPQLQLTAKPEFTVGQTGKVALKATDAGIELALTAMSGPAKAGTRHSWELFLDARPADKRTGLYGPGAFHVVIQPDGKAGAGPVGACPPATVTATKDPATSIVRLDWKQLATNGNGKPSDFALGVILNTKAGDTLVQRDYKFANAASYRLANPQAVVVVDPTKSPATKDNDALPEGANDEQLAWGYLAIADDLIVGTTVAQSDSQGALKYGWDFSSENHDYTGPAVRKVLGLLGLAEHTKRVFALDKSNGRLRWSYEAAGAVNHNAIAIGDGRVYLIDKPLAPAGAKSSAPSRRGKATPPAPAGKLVVLDLATGQRLWTIDALPGEYKQVRLGHGVLLVAGMQGMTAYTADAGKKLWEVNSRQPMHHCSAFVRAPAITGKWVYDEPYAYDLRTGKTRMLSTPDGPGGDPWRWNGGRGCGTISTSEHMLFYRVGAPALLDLTTNATVRLFEGIRPGCYINMIPAGGLLLIPEASSGCGCPYSFQTTVALQPAVAAESPSSSK